MSFKKDAKVRDTDKMLTNTHTSDSPKLLTVPKGQKKWNEKWIELTFQVSVNVISGVILSVLLWFLGSAILQRWFESYVHISKISDKNFGKHYDAFIGKPKESEDFVVVGKVGEYFAKRRFEYEIAIIVEDSSGTYYLQDRSGKIDDQDGTWSVKKIILGTPKHDYKIFAIVAKSISEIREKMPPEGFWRNEEEFESIKSYISARSKEYSVKRSE